MTKIKNKYSKPFKGYLNIRSDFFDIASNNHHVKKLKQIDEFYSQQPQRNGCKLCNEKFDEALFIRNKIKYFECKNCGHLTGEYQDTKEYCENLYTPDNKNGEMKIYKDDNIRSYKFRTENIYLPKAKFLYDQLKNNGLVPSNLKYLDIGSGTGHMIMAMRELGLHDSLGYDVTEENVEFGNDINNTEILKLHKLNDINKIILETEASVITSIFMLEHVQYPLDLCKTIKKNKNIKYLLLAVPMFSVGVMLEQAFPHLRKRSLGAGHTHLFTEKSIKWMCSEVGFEVLTNWWFGADSFDFHRFIHMQLKQNLDKNSLFKKWDKMISPVLNDIQQVFDKQKLSSEVHIFIRVNS